MLLKYFRTKYTVAKKVFKIKCFSGKFIKGNLSVVSDMALYYTWE